MTRRLECPYCHEHKQVSASGFFKRHQVRAWVEQGGTRRLVSVRCPGSEVLIAEPIDVVEKARRLEA